MTYFVALFAGTLWGPFGAILLTSKVKRVDVADVTPVQAINHFIASSFWILATAAPPALITYAFVTVTKVAPTQLHVLSLAAAIILPSLALGELRRRKADENG